jgi:BlaI family penicillinase repressor
MSPRISESEWEVMNVIWAHQAMTAVEVFEGLPRGHGWRPKTVNTFLTRLVGKGILNAKKEGRAFLYSARRSRDECVRAEGASFVDRVFQGAAGDLVLHFCKEAKLSEEDIQELEELLKAKRRAR